MNRRGVLSGAAAALGVPIGRFALGPRVSTTAIVVGVGGAGSSVVERVAAEGIAGVHLAALDTDAQALLSVRGRKELLLAASTLKGLGCGADPELARLAAIEDRARIQRALRGVNLVIVTAGMGGGTGSGASPVVAQIASGLGIPVVGVVTTPMNFEYRMQVADDGIAELRRHADRVIVSHGDDVLHLIDEDTPPDAYHDPMRDVQVATIRRIVRFVRR